MQAGADVNGTGCFVPPVVLAAYKGLDRCIQCLLRNGANPNVPDEVSSTLLFLNFNISCQLLGSMPILIVHNLLGQMFHTTLLGFRVISKGP